MNQAKDFDHLTVYQKHHALRCLNEDDAMREKLSPIKNQYPDRNIVRILWVSNDIQLVEIKTTEQDRKYFGNNCAEYFTSVVNGNSSSCLHYSIEEAFLKALEIKYEGANCQFTKYAVRMLDIKTEEDSDV